MVYPDLSESTLCTQEEGCCCTEGGIAGPHYIIHVNLNGFSPYGEYHPTELIHLLADEHETTHFFLYQMLHYIPSWFHEAIAIQTNERLRCDTKAQPFNYGMSYEHSLSGDSYLRETPVDLEHPEWGMCMNDECTLLLNEDFYEKLKKGGVSLSEDQKEPHIIGTLWIMGMKLDYNCVEDCIKGIVIKLKDFEMENCKAGTGCGVDPLSGFTQEHINNSIIKQKTEEIVGEDTSALFDLLEIEY